MVSLDEGSSGLGPIRTTQHQGEGVEDTDPRGFMATWGILNLVAKSSSVGLVWLLKQ